MEFKIEEKDEEEEQKDVSPEFRVRSFVGTDMLEENVEQISYIKLKRHIEQNHPCNDDGESYGMCEELGWLPCMNLCFDKKKNKATKKDEINVTEVQKRIGLGPSLLLMTTKALGYLFLYLTILNIPVYLFYYSGNMTKVTNVTENFSKLSLGNIGQS